jgi:hypothetical protein
MISVDRKARKSDHSLPIWSTTVTPGILGAAGQRCSCQGRVGRFAFRLDALGGSLRASATIFRPEISNQPSLHVVAYERNDHDGSWLRDGSRSAALRRS